MENKKQDPAFQAPAEANRNKHLNYLAAEEQNLDEKISEDKKNEKDEVGDQSSKQSIRNKHDADSGNDSTNQMLQSENLIDPGNEHNHLKDPKTRTDDYHSKKNDAEAGSDATGSTGTKPE